MSRSANEVSIADMVDRMLVEDAPREMIVAAIADAEADLRSRSGRRSRGTRLLPNWRPSKADVSFAVACGLTAEQVEVESEKFRNYWTAKSGQGATKLDWGATWRNWVISTMERTNATASGAGRAGSRVYPASRPAASGADAILAGMARIAHRIDERCASSRPEDRKAPHDGNAAPQLDLKRGGT